MPGSINIHLSFYWGSIRKTLIHYERGRFGMRVMAMALAAMMAGSLVALADDQSAALVSGPDAVKWGPAPPALPKRAEIAVLSGDLSKSEEFVVRLKMPAGYEIPAHHHPTTENVTVLSGSFHAGMGDKLDKAKGETFVPGGFASLPAGMNHYAWTTAETIVQVHGQGPFAITYVNPADDPSKSQ
jgi:quercetin dioxygenase-like cupin family protein